MKHEFLRAGTTAFVVAVVTMLFATGCRDENPDLIDPPYGEDSVVVRFYNGVFDNVARTLEFEGYEITNVPAGAISANMQVGIDSSLVTISNAQDIEYQTLRRVRMPRSSSLLFYGLDTNGIEGVDTLVYTLASPVSESFPEPLITFVNANPVAEREYSVRLGCPNGSVIASDIAYLQQTFPVEIDTGLHTISVMERYPSMPQQIVGYYEFVVREGDRLTLLAKTNGLGEPEFELVDMFSRESSPLRTLTQVEETFARIRIVNMTASSIDVRRNDSELIVSDLTPQTATNFTDLVVCNSLATDIIAANPIGISEGGQTARSLQVSESYSVFVGDSSQGDAATVVIAEPFSATPDANSVAIRTISLLPPDMKVNVSLGMRTDVLDQTSSGTGLASNLGGGEATKTVVVPAGPLPITVISEGNPERLVNAVYVQPTPGHSYSLLLFMSDGEPRVALFDEQFNAQPELLTQGVFVQLIDARVSASPTNFTLGSTIRNAAFADGGSSATVLPEGEHEFIADLTIETVPAVVGKRLMLIATGSQNDPHIVTQSYSPLLAENNEYKYRFIHAAYGAPTLTVALDSRADIATSDLSYGALSGASTGVIERSYSLLYFDNANVQEDPIYQADNIAFVRGSASTIIFGGTAEQYILVIQQEF